MRPIELVEELHRIVNKAYKAGYVLTGTIEFYKPKERRVVQDVQANVTNPIMWYRISTKSEQKSQVDTQVYTGNVCPTCNSPKMIRSGTCETCLNCGSTSGCG